MIAPDVRRPRGVGGGVGERFESEKWGENNIQQQDGEGERRQEIGRGNEGRRRGDVKGCSRRTGGGGGWIKGWRALGKKKKKGWGVKERKGMKVREPRGAAR